MIHTSDLTLRFGSRTLFENVNVKFVAGNCYGLIGANGAGKSTFLRILAGVESPSSGEVVITPGQRLSFLRQDHFAFEDQTVLHTVIQGNPTLFALMKEREEIYSKEEMSDEDVERIGDLEAEFNDLEGWEAETEVATLLKGLGIDNELLGSKMKELEAPEKIKVLLAQALFGKPDILLLDEPTNYLDAKAIKWLEEFLFENEKVVIVVSHDRHFLNQVCTHIADLDFNKIQLYSGNYDFWYESSQLAQKLQADQHRKIEEKAKDLKEFIARFSANASKSKQATSRKKLLEKLTLDDIRPSTRKYPFVHFKPDREAGDLLLKVEQLGKTVEDKVVFSGLDFQIETGDKVLFTGDELAVSMLFDILAGREKQDQGGFSWGVTTTQSYFPKDNASFFPDPNLSIADWLRQFSEDPSESYIRGLLGQMLFSGDESQKKVGVLSGGEKVRCMLARMMTQGANVLILDGPTNHLDLESITAVNQSLIRFPGTVLFACHDHQFNQSVASRVFEVQVRGVRLYDMDYEAYLAKQ